ncbi:hypothetical protein RF11_03206 [Thelohanellus kitauei]|uniref:Reverse transcriptase RNase H-like domain-containing protein n=1 Tax=Thelohanellus kitauei TaxID=669202 RepID=A0A0C2MPL9_THEKT|nr:hypothetical protein RF11_03206 [Thelohanellus kitauei]
MKSSATVPTSCILFEEIFLRRTQEVIRMPQAGQDFTILDLISERADELWQAMLKSKSGKCREPCSVTNSTSIGAKIATDLLVGRSAAEVSDIPLQSDKVRPHTSKLSSVAKSHDMLKILLTGFPNMLVLTFAQTTTKHGVKQYIATKGHQDGINKTLDESIGLSLPHGSQALRKSKTSGGLQKIERRNHSGPLSHPTYTGFFISMSGMHYYFKGRLGQREKVQAIQQIQKPFSINGLQEFNKWYMSSSGSFLTDATTALTNNPSKQLLAPGSHNWSIVYGNRLICLVRNCDLLKLDMARRIFTAFTDHKPLTFSFEKVLDTWSSRQYRHLAAISEFTTYMKHLSGKVTVVADAPSRMNVNPLQSTTPGIDYEEMAKA